MTDTKLCPDCEETKPISDFRKNKAKRDGLASYCTVCDNIRDANRRANRAASFDVSKLPENKTCPRCETEKPRESFAIAKGSSNGLATYCKDCNKIVKAEIRKRNLDSFDEKKLPTEKVCSNCKETKLAKDFCVNPWERDGLRGVCNDCSKIIAAARRLQKVEQDVVSLKLYDMLQAAKQRAKKDNLPFDLDMDHIRSIMTENCPVFGLPFDMYAKKPSDMSPSIDQFRSGYGYTKGHVRIISYKANRMKNDGTTEDVVKLANWMLKTEAEISEYELS